MKGFGQDGLEAVRPLAAHPVRLIRKEIPRDTSGTTFDSRDTFRGSWLESWTAHGRPAGSG